MNHSAPNFESFERPGNRKRWLLVIGVLLLCAGNAYLLSRVNHLQVRAQTLQGALDSELTKFQQSSALRSIQTQREMEALRQEIQEALQEASKKATSEARKETGWLARNVAKSQRDQQEQVLGELRNVEGSTVEAHRKIEGVNTELTTVKSEIGETKSQIEETHAALDSTAAHLDTVDALIVRNQNEISNLRQLSERERYLFNLKKSKFMQKVAGIQLRLRKTDAKHNKYSIEVLADDRKVVKKEKHINEPVQFYVTGAARPYELVVTRVTKDGVVGYLTRPKADSLRG